MPTKIFFLGLLAGVSILSSTALAQSSNGKVAVLNYSAVIRESSAGKRLFGELEQKVTARRTQFEQKSNEISTLQRQLVEQTASLNPDAQRALTKNIDSKNTQLKRDQEDAQKEFSAMQQQIVRQIATQLRPVVEKYAQDQKISLIVNLSQEVFFVNPAIEITQEIIEQFDNSAAAGSTSAAQ
jgi:Skp family chaperone for outer membrane proteins